MVADALTVNAVRDGPVSTLILCGDLYLPETGGFLEQAALAVDDRTERLVLDLAGVTFLDCTGIRALSIAARLAPARSSSARSVPWRAGSLSYWAWIWRTSRNSAWARNSRTGSRMEGLLSGNWPRWSRAPRSSPGPRDARDYRVQRTRLPVPAHPARRMRPLTAWLFGDAAIESDGGCTSVIFSARDDSELHGLLDRSQDVALHLISLNQIGGSSPAT